MLKLIYQSSVFGPIELEYDRPIIRVGRNDDNDLVLRHPSVAPYDSVLLFRGERVIRFPADRAPTEPAQSRLPPGAEYSAGEILQLGELRFTLAYSSKTVAIPTPPAAVQPSDAPAPPAATYFCPHCHAFIPEAHVKRMGLVGHAKKDLCPKCSRPLEKEVETAPEPPKPAPQTPAKRGWRQAFGVILTM